MALTKVGGDIIRQPLDIGSLNATTVQIGAATTVHTTGIDVGSGSVTGHNIHSTGIVTATSFVGPVTGNLTGNVTGNADTASNLTGSPSITVTNITAAGNVSIAGTLTYEDVTNIDAVGVVTARAGVNISGGNLQVGGTNVINSGRVLYNLEQLKLADTKELVLGSGNDLKIQHSGSHSFISQEGVGALKIKGDDIRFEDAGGTEALRIRSDGKLMTQSAGYVYTAASAGSLSLYGGNTNLGGGIILGGGNGNADIRFLAQASTATPAERLRITSGGNVQVNGGAVHIDANGELAVFETDTNLAFTNSSKIAFDFSSNVARIRTSFNGSGSVRPLAFYTGNDERLRIASNGTITAGPQYDQVKIEPGNGTYDGEATTLSVDGRTNDGNRVALKVDRYDSGTSATTKFSVKYDGLVNIGGAQFTTNTTPSSGRGVEIFAASAGVGQVQSYNRGSSSWDELRLKGSEVRLYANNNLRLDVQNAQSYLYGTSDGILNLDTTDQRGAFIRFKENGTTKGWSGCSEGIGTGGDQDDFGIRAVGGFRLKTGANNSIEITDEGQIALRPITGGFTTQGASHTYPGAAVSIQCHGVGAGTGTNIPQYGLYVDGAYSSNDATLMTGVFATAKQNVQGSAIGIHGLYQQDWNSYSKKIGGLFQAPARAPRNSTRSFNPGGGIFANTTSTGFANRLAVGAARPDGNTSGNNYGDATALWGDAFRSDTDTSSDFCDSIAVKATNRVTHGRSRVGLMVGTVDGSDTSHNRRRVQAVEYYTDDTYQRFYNRNHKKEMNHHEPLFMSTTDGSRNTMNNVWTANYYVQKYQGANQYSWYFYNTISAGYARNGRLKFDIIWTTGHASGVGEAEYSVAYTVPHSGGTIDIRRCTRFHQWSIGGSYYGWNWNPDVSFFKSTSTGANAGIYLRLTGAQSPFDGYVVQSIKLEALECNYGFSQEASFRWVSHSTPSDAVANPENINGPST